MQGYIKEASQLERWDQAPCSLYDQAQTVADIVKQSKERQRAEKVLRCHRLLLDYAGMADSLDFGRNATPRYLALITSCKPPGCVISTVNRPRTVPSLPKTASTSADCALSGWPELAWRQDEVEAATTIWQHALDNNRFEASRVLRSSDMKYLLELCVNAEVPELPGRIDTVVDFHISYIHRINQPWDRRLGTRRWRVVKPQPMMLSEAHA